MASRDSAERRAIAAVGGATYAANATAEDTAAAAARAREALRQRFLDQADPDGVMPLDERERKATAIRRLHYRRLALRKAQVERERREAAELDAHRALETELAADHNH